MSIRRKPRRQVASRIERVQEATRHGADMCRQGAATASERITPAAQHTREVAAERLTAARGWSAPRLHTAARYVEADLGPRVSTMLDGAADRVEPAGRGRRRGRKAAFFMVAAVAAIGAAGVLFTRRKAAQEMADPPEQSSADTDADAKSDGEVRTPR
ncbi:hypothetical protein [Actinomadura yumaensis]|uniref:DUF3618 domain-containing protein n=1 Tax=Actinomadura yumaensis TaxID=111807 RepID=A0ABW2CRR7_9ACTN